MKTMGLIGGTSPASTVEYYRIINSEINYMMGSQHSADLLLASVDFENIVRSIFANNWYETGMILSDAALKLEKAGADFIVLCSNTLHRVLPMIESVVDIPILHILESVSKLIRQQKIKQVALLGTTFTMQQEFHKKYLQTHSFAEVIVPDRRAQAAIDELIFDELCYGIVNPASQRKFANIIENLQKRGAEAIVLGCTELPLLAAGQDYGLPTFNTLEIHARATAKFALQNIVVLDSLVRDATDIFGATKMIEHA